MLTTTEDMSASFLKLPGELRNRVYELCLLDQEPLNPQIGFYKEDLALGLLYVNRAIHSEASSLLYAQNRFDFTATDPEDIDSFLEKIGRNNANSIQHVCVDFPILRNLDLGNVILDQRSISILANIQSGCANLSTLTMSLYSTDAMELTLDELDDPKITTEALTLVNTRFKAILSLQKIIVEVFESGPSDYIRREMESHGWTISATERAEEWETDRSLSDIEYDWGSDHSFEDDDYDIDNDSDFWRRAED